MRAADRQGGGALLAVVGALAAISVVTHLGRWLGAMPSLARSPLVPGLAGDALRASAAQRRRGFVCGFACGCVCGFVCGCAHPDTDRPQPPATPAIPPPRQS